MLVMPWSFVERYAGVAKRPTKRADALRMSVDRLAEDAEVTCHRTFSHRRLEPRRLMRLAARREQQARGAAGLGCAAERLLW
jgi:hypothetical protein